MLRVLLVAALLVCGQVGVSPGQDAAPSELSTKVRALARNLDHDEKARRDAAEKQLIALGPNALNHLPAVSPRTSAEMKERLGRIRNTLEKVAAEAATKASLITLKGEMSLADALSALEKQSGNKVVGFEKRGGKVNVKFDQTPYWQALDAVLDQVGMNINQYGGQTRALSLISQPDEQLPRSGRASYNGIFRFEAVTANAVRDLRNPQVNSMRVKLEVGWEPHTFPISLAIPTGEIKSVDEDGDAVLIDANQRELEARVQADIPVVEFVVPFQLPDRSVKKIASLKGKMVAMIPGRTETFEFSDLDKLRDVEKRRAGVTVTFEQMRKNAEIYEVRMRVRFDRAANALESHRGWIYNNEAYVVDADGKKLMPATFETTRQEVDEVGMAYLFDLEKGPAGCKFVYQTPAAIIKMPVEFTLKDIELP